MARMTSSRDLPPFDNSALLLDLDGTLLDIAPRPDAVIVPPSLLATLHSLRRRLGDALAVVSGRPVEQIEMLLGDGPFAIAGEHGGAIRHGPDQGIERQDMPSPPASWLSEAERIAASNPGVLLEHKANGFVLHYRAVPEAGLLLLEALEALLAGSDRFALMPARKAWEVKPRGADKGSAVAKIMDRPPFTGRKPMFIGDDVTDEDGIAMAHALGGVGLLIPATFGDPSRVRAWLERADKEGSWPAW
ncbi:MAG: trehalose-phosphatase [Acetobacteraceae bacterium]|nr:trehalose-phosphatase [Acetobacteraceae bacterium]